MIAPPVLRAAIGGLAVAVLAVAGGLVGRTVAPERAPNGPYAAPARLMVLAPDEVSARVGAPVDFGTAEVPLGVTPDFAREGALAMLEAATAALDPQSALPPPTVTPAPEDRCVVVGERPRGCPEGLDAVLQPDDRMRLVTARVAGQAECEGTAVVAQTGAPARVTVTWWSPDDAVRSMEADTNDALTCIPLPDVAGDTRYEVNVTLGEQFRQFALDTGGGALRPAAVVFAPTPDLIAVTVPHRPGDSVRVFPNVLTGDEPRCDEITIGYDLFVRPVGSVSASIPAAELEAARLDPQFTERVTHVFDVGEGHTVFLCAVVTTADGVEEYVAQTTVETADRVTAVARVVQATVPDVPEWHVSASLAGGQACGAWTPGPGELGDLIYPSGERPVLCDPSDELGSRIAGRGVLPYSTAYPTSLTVQLGSAHWGLHTASIDLGEGARCTGFCAVPERSYVEVSDRRGGSVMLQVTWGQGSTNGADATRVAPVSDTLTVPLPGPRLDAGTARFAIVSGQDETRGVTANLYLRADQEVDYVARLVPASGQTACERPGARLELSGHLAAFRPTGGIVLPGEWSERGTLRFTGLCHGTVYQAVVELTGEDGRTTVWGADGAATPWGAASRLSVPPFTLAVTLDYSVLGHSAGGNALISLFVDGVRVLGPAGACTRVNRDAEGRVPAQLLLGETSRFSGTVDYQPADISDRSCLPRPMDAIPSVPFAIDLDYEALAAGPTELIVRNGDAIVAIVVIEPESS